MEPSPYLPYIIAGQLRRDYILLPDGRGGADIPGGSLLYAAAGMALWGETSTGLIARIGEDYPHEWLENLAQRGFDTRGIHVLPESVDARWFAVYSDRFERQTSAPIANYARLNRPFPKTLLGFQDPVIRPDARNQATILTLRQTDFPTHYLDARAAHLCPMDYLSHTLMPQMLRTGNVTTLTIDPGEGYMTPEYFDDLPAILNGVTALLTSEEKLKAVFHGRSSQVWEMIETIGSFGCPVVVVKRGAQGQYIYDASRGARWSIPAYPVQPKDPTGAGDAFCGGFLAGFVRHYDPLEASLHGNISASFVVEVTGPFSAMEAYRPLVNARLDALRDMVRKL